MRHRRASLSRSWFGVVPRPRATATGRSGEGPTGAASRPTRDYATSGRADKNIAWKAPGPGRGHSSPVVWGAHMFLTTSSRVSTYPETRRRIIWAMTSGPATFIRTVGRDYKYALKVMAFDTRTGRQLWEQTAYDGLMYDNRHRKNTYASPTPVTDGSLVYAFFEAAGYLRVRLHGQAGLEERSLGRIAKGAWGQARRRFCRGPADPAGRPGNGRRLRDRRARPNDGQGSLAHDTDAPGGAGRRR